MEGICIYRYIPINIMNIEYIKAKNEDAVFLRKIFKTGQRHFQQGIRTILLEAISHSDEIVYLIENKSDVGKKAGGVCRINELIRDIGLVFNGAISIDIGEVSAIDLTQQLIVRLNGEVVFRNAMSFLPTSICKQYRSFSGLWLMDAILARKDIVLSKNIKYVVDASDIELTGSMFSGGNSCWITNAFKRAAKDIDELILNTIQYLEGRKT